MTLSPSLSSLLLSPPEDSPSLSLPARTRFRFGFGFYRGLDGAEPAVSILTGAGTEPAAGGVQFRLRASSKNATTALGFLSLLHVLECPTAKWDTTTAKHSGLVRTLVVSSLSGRPVSLWRALGSFPFQAAISAENFSGLLYFFPGPLIPLCSAWCQSANCSAWRSFLWRGEELIWALMWLCSPSMLSFLLAIRFAPGSIAISRSPDPIDTSRIVGCMNRGHRLLRRCLENFGCFPPLF